jgi:hypothetical protein
MQTSDLISLIGDGISLAVAIFTALAARAAWASAKASREAVAQANTAAAESRTIAKEQTAALLTAAKANALASRINFYTEQMHRLNAYGHATGQLDALEQKQKHLAGWLDQQTDALGVGLKNPLPSSTQT